MINNLFDTTLHFLGKNKSDTFIANIGAMDGILYDDLYKYTSMYSFKGLYVEPIPYLFEKLKNNIKGDNIFENSAISEYDGEIEMITLKKEPIDSGLVHDCYYGMSAVYPPKNGMGYEANKSTIDEYGERVMVKCITFETLIKKHNIETIDVIQIDAEGHDYKIFKQIDIDKIKPKIIRLEWYNLFDDERKEIINIFEKYNYKYENDGYDITGISPEMYNLLINDLNK